MLLGCLFAKESLKKFRYNIDDFDANSNDKDSFYGPIVQNVNVLLVLLWWMFGDCLKKHCWNSKDFDANIHDHKLFFLLISETLIFLCCFSHDSLINHWKLIDGTVEISMEAKLTPKFFLRQSLKRWCFIAG